eukprot:CAMPEP_0194037692 /NCGR_PEP_ID=MMETSP0009_2-20130614/10020_1 /TAXON_ID=210454 /ORGANISM="Grammatophora oceanica, Strain CCMP 410" /LENGTH=211 /DNA_ID=CAMNT_0038679947 /DNA_START=148 /DNA_END=785 /DNA_ORIENTATION=-
MEALIGIIIIGDYLGSGGFEGEGYGNAKQNQYLEHIRETHDPQLHIKTLEDELKGTIGKALGKQGEKVLYHMKCMAAERGRYEELVCSKSDASSKSKLVDVAKRHNMYREEAIKARWELLVHRQAVGFIVNNHEFVHKKFPIGDALNEEGVEVIQAPDEENQTGKKENPTVNLIGGRESGDGDSGASYLRLLDTSDEYESPEKMVSATMVQ